MTKLTPAYRSLVRLIDKMDARYMTRNDARRHGLVIDLDRAQRAGLLVSAGYETSARADDWLNSEAGRAALEDTRHAD